MSDFRYPNAARLNPDATQAEKAVHELTLAMLASMPSPSIYMKEHRLAVTTKPDGEVVAKCRARLAADGLGKEVCFLVCFNRGTRDYAERPAIHLYARCGDYVVCQDWMLYPHENLLAVDWGDTGGIPRSCLTVLTTLRDLPRFVETLRAGVENKAVAT